MMKIDNKKKLFGLILSIVFVFLLVLFTSIMTYSILDEVYSSKDVKVNEETVKYISFLFEHNDYHVLEVKNPKVVSDEVGKLLFGEDYFTFDISIDEEQLVDGDLDYIVTAEAIGKTINEDYIKFYLTDEDGNVLYNDETVPVFSDFEEEKDISGKVIYSGKFNEKVTSKSLKLRVWISDEYEIDDIAGFSYHLNVIAK